LARQVSPPLGSGGLLLKLRRRDIDTSPPPPRGGLTCLNGARVPAAIRLESSSGRRGRLNLRVRYVEADESAACGEVDVKLVAAEGNDVARAYDGLLRARLCVVRGARRALAEREGGVARERGGYQEPRGTPDTLQTSSLHKDLTRRRTKA